MAVTIVKKRPEPEALVLGGVLITPQAWDDFKGLYPAGTKEELENLLDEMTPVTHVLGNQRNGDTVFSVRRGKLLGMCFMEDTQRPAEMASGCETCGGRGYLVFYDECPSCGAEGCGRCEEGMVKVQRPCPDKNCTTTKRNQSNGAHSLRGKRGTR